MTDLDLRLWVHHDVIDRLSAVAPRPCEVGGWLLGYWTASEREVVLTHATPPASRGWPWGVRITGMGHRDRFEAAWSASEGHVTFLGDWHTHPGGPATPSMRDREAMKQLATDDDYGTPHPVIAIVATGKWPWSRAVADVAFYLRASDEGVDVLAHKTFDELPRSAKRVPPLGW